MFDNLKVPTLALVENMAYFECEHGTKYYPFGTRACWHARAASPRCLPTALSSCILHPNRHQLQTHTREHVRLPGSRVFSAAS